MSGLYTKFVSALLFPLQERLKRHDTVAVRRAMESSQWLSPDDLGALQLERLRHLLARAAAYVPYYRALFARIGFDPAKVRSVADLQALPFLTKADIRANTEALKSERAEGLARFNTGGSSGEPLNFFIGRERVSHDVAAKWRATRWWDVDIGDREIVVWGSSIELGAQDRVRKLRDGLMRSELMPAFDMSEARMEDFVARIRARRPAMMFGYPSSISLLAAHAEKRGQRLDDLGCKVVFVTSERCYDHQRETIERVFGCPVANGYGGRDAGFIAHQCPLGSMHLTAEDIVIEIVRDDGRVLAAGEPGEIVVTHLATADFPFIRYRTGDVGVLTNEQCPCGRGLPLIKEIQGRSTDFVVASDGKVMHGLSLIYVMRELTSVSAFKIVQESLQLIRVIVVPAAGFSDSDRTTIVAGFRDRLGASVDVSLELVDSLAPEQSGKFRYVISRVAPS